MMNMKRIIPILMLSLVAVFTACNKDTPHNTDSQVGISRVTHFPTFTMTGSQYVSLVQGTPYTEPGIKAFENGTQIPVTTTGTVNVNTPGIYVLTYTATNKDGYPASTSRTVVVLSGHENPGVNLSGKYAYVGSSVYLSTVTKVAEGTYTTDNAWSGATIIPIVFTSLNGTTLSIPSQQTAFGEAHGTGTFNTVTGRLVYTLTLTNQNISNSNRTWQKQ